MRAAHKAEQVVDVDALRQQFSFHSLRHSMVSHLAAAGVARSLVQDLVGHESAAVNASYTHFDVATKLAAMNKLPDIL